MGFTIIEVVLVLAIAGLIFAAVFIALPALQRSQRNTQRRNDLAMIKTAIEQWKTHNRNRKSINDNFSRRNSSDGFCTFYKKYLHDDYRDPSTGEPYLVTLWGSDNAVDCLNNMTYPRGFDLDVHGNNNNGDDDTWGAMEVGDFQYNDTGICTEGGDFTDDVADFMGYKKDNGTSLFALRMRLEGGSTLCIDAGY